MDESWPRLNADTSDYRAQEGVVTTWMRRGHTSTQMQAIIGIKKAWSRHGCVVATPECDYKRGLVSTSAHGAPEGVATTVVATPTSDYVATSYCRVVVSTRKRERCRMLGHAVK